MLDDVPSATLDAASHIKRVALKLFAEHGIDGVTVREIAKAAGQKNHASITYHFGSKEALVRELVADGARDIDQRRNAWLDEVESAGGPKTVFEIMLGILKTSIDQASSNGGEFYNRFIAGLQLSNRALFIEALEGKWNSGYLRCLGHIRSLYNDTPSAELNRTLVFVTLAIGGILAGRETGLSDKSREHPMWSDPKSLEDAAQTLAAMVESVRFARSKIRLQAGVQTNHSVNADI